MQEFGWLAHYARGGSGMDYNEAQLRKQKWSVANRVVKKAMRHRRAAVQARDSSACGDCTQTLLRMTPGQGMAPDGSAGESPLTKFVHIMLIHGRALEVTASPPSWAWGAATSLHHCRWRKHTGTFSCSVCRASLTSFVLPVRWWQIPCGCSCACSGSSLMRQYK